MKVVLLEHPRSVDPERCNDIANTPLSSSLLTGYSAAMLKSGGHEVEIVEGYLDGLSYEEIEQRVRSIEPGILGVHMVYNWKGDAELFGFLEKVKGEGLSPYSPENIVEEMDRIISERVTREFYFTDPNFFGPGQRGQERALRLSLLKARDIRFGIEARVNDIHDETIGALVEAGLRHMLIGLESGSDHSLRRLNKMTTVTENERALRILRKHGIEPNIGFIMFEPDASLEDVRINFEFLRRNDLLRNLPITANVLYHHQIILKGTPAYRSLQREGRLKIPFCSTYEGIPSFTDHRVEVLAYIMRHITSFLFTLMGGIWSGKVEEPGGAAVKYEKMNRLLVERFEAILKSLEGGERFPAERKAALVDDARKELEAILQDWSRR